MDPFFPLWGQHHRHMSDQIEAHESIVPSKPISIPKWRVFFITTKGKHVRRGSAYGWTIAEAASWYSKFQWPFWVRKFGYPAHAHIYLELIKTQSNQPTAHVTSGIQRI